MSANQRQNDIRKEILLQLYGVRPLQITAARIARDSRKQGYDYSESEIIRELYFLSDSGLITSDTQAGTTDQVYRIHASGVIHYEQHFA